MLALAAVLLAANALHAQSYSTNFIARQNASFNARGNWWYQPFTLSAQTTFVVRFASRYSADCAILPANQLANFTGGRGYRGYAIFDNRFGTTTVTLPRGDYCLAVRNETQGQNKYSVELDYSRAPSGQRIISYGISGSRNISGNGGQLWHEFSWNSNRGQSLYIDGCNSDNVVCHIIPASELSNWRQGRAFDYYKQWDGGYAPGLEWLNLPSGRFYFVARNNGRTPEALTYNAWITGR